MELTIGQLSPYGYEFSIEAVNPEEFDNIIQVRTEGVSIDWILNTKEALLAPFKEINSIGYFNAIASLSCRDIGEMLRSNPEREIFVSSMTVSDGMNTYSQVEMILFYFDQDKRINRKRAITLDGERLYLNDSFLHLREKEEDLILDLKIEIVGRFDLAKIV